MSECRCLSHLFSSNRSQNVWWPDALNESRSLAHRGERGWNRVARWSAQLWTCDEVSVSAPISPSTLGCFILNFYFLFPTFLWISGVKPCWNSCVKVWVEKKIFRGRAAIKTEKMVPISTLTIKIGESSRQMSAFLMSRVEARCTNVGRHWRCGIHRYWSRRSRPDEEDVHPNDAAQRPRRIAPLSPCIKPPRNCCDSEQLCRRHEVVFCNTSRVWRRSSVIVYWLKRVRSACSPLTSGTAERYMVEMQVFSRRNRL